MKIKIIDLLNKIYNLEDMPRKIIFENQAWYYCSEFQDYQTTSGYLFGDYMSHINETAKFLNDEVEITEDDKKIEFLRTTTNDKALIEFKDKINEIIDAVNKLKVDD